MFYQVAWTSVFSFQPCTRARVFFAEVLREVRRQISETPEIRVEVIWEADNGELTLGSKRNKLVDRCQGKYQCFIDDDDVIAPYFVKTFVPMIQSGFANLDRIGSDVPITSTN
jgi:hypothetical protein